MLDYDYEDIDGMDDDAGDDQEPAPTGHWKTTSSYDIYMVDIPKVGNGEEKAEEDSSKKQPKRRRQRHRSKSRHSKNEDSGTGDNNTPDNAEDNPLQQDAAQEDGDASPYERQEKRQRIIRLPPETKRASTMMNSSCLRIPSNKSILNAGLWPRRTASRKSSNSLELIRIC